MSIHIPTLLFLTLLSHGHHKHQPDTYASNLSALQAHLQTTHGVHVNSIKQYHWPHVSGEFESLFPNHVFIEVRFNVEPNNGKSVEANAIYVTRKDKTGWYFFFGTPTGPKYTFVQPSPKTIARLAQEARLRFRSAEEVKRFTKVYYRIPGTINPMRCGTGLEFRERIEQTSTGWQVAREYRHVYRKPKGNWQTRQIINLEIDERAFLKGISCVNPNRHQRWISKDK